MSHYIVAAPDGKHMYCKHCGLSHEDCKGPCEAAELNSYYGAAFEEQCRVAEPKWKVMEDELPPPGEVVETPAGRRVWKDLGWIKSPWMGGWYMPERPGVGGRIKDSHRHDRWRPVQEKSDGELKAGDVVSVEACVVSSVTVNRAGIETEPKAEPKVVREKHELPHGFELLSAWYPAVHRFRYEPYVAFKWLERSMAMPWSQPGESRAVKKWDEPVVKTEEESEGDAAQGLIRATVARLCAALGHAYDGDRCKHCGEER